MPGQISMWPGSGLVQLVAVGPGNIPVRLVVVVLPNHVIAPASPVPASQSSSTSLHSSGAPGWVVEALSSQSVSSRVSPLGVLSQDVSVSTRWPKPSPSASTWNVVKVRPLVALPSQSWSTASHSSVAPG